MSYIPYSSSSPRHSQKNPHPHALDLVGASSARVPRAPTDRGREMYRPMSSNRPRARAPPAACRTLRPAACRELRHPHVCMVTSSSSRGGSRDRGEGETGGRREKRIGAERSGSVSRILRDGANLHIGGIFSQKRLRSRCSPSKQPRERIDSAPLP
jgi:hypothetical protein